jgi:hypothetical protein
MKKLALILACLLLRGCAPLPPRPRRPRGGGAAGAQCGIGWNPNALTPFLYSAIEKGYLQRRAEGKHQFPLQRQRRHLPSGCRTV